MIRLLIMACACVGGSAAVVRADWPVFRGSAAMTGVGTATLPDKLEEIWTFDCKDSIEGAPAIVDGVVYVAALDRNLYAIDYATGALKWKTPLGAMKAGPAVRAGRVYVGDLEGKLHAVEAATGKPVWVFDTGGEIHAGANFIDDDILIGSHIGSLFRVSPAGKPVWEFKIDGPVNGSAAVVGERAFVAGCDSLLHVVDTTTGKGLSTVDIAGQAGATAAVEADQAFVGTMANQLIGADWKAPKKLWAFEARRRQQPFYSSAAVTPEFVIVGSRDKKLYAVDRKTGREAWSITTEGNVDASPVVVNNRVYVGCLSGSGEFYVVNLADGQVVQELTLGSAVTGSAAVGPDALLVGTEKGLLVKLGAKP